MAGLVNGSDRVSQAYYLHFVTDARASLKSLYIEVAGATGRGVVLREIGLDSEANVIHRTPSPVHRFGDYGIFDGAIARFDFEEERSDLTQDEFESLWDLPDLVPPPPAFRRMTGLVAGIRQNFGPPSFKSLVRAPVHPE